MDISQYLKSLTSQQFEVLCVELLRFMKPEVYRIVGTRYVKDGGRDIIGTVDDVPYEIWAECKKHTRALGLEEISKNVILVISQDINELFFFSTSDISRHAQKHISVVAAKHGFKIAFYYGHHLINALSQLPRFKDSAVASEYSDELIISHYISKYEHSDRYENKDVVILNRDNYFYIDIFLKNRSNFVFSDITVDWSNSDYIKLSIKDIDNHIEINSYNDRVIQIKGEVLNCKTKHRIPTIKISYIVNGEYKDLQISAGIIDPTQLLYFPLIGEKPNMFLLQQIKPILTDNNPTDSYIIDIRGESGNGKSRMLKEISKIGVENGKRIIQFDARKYNDFTIVKEFICTLLYIPYNKGSVEVSSRSIKNILTKHNADETFSDAIYSFIFENKTTDDNTYFVKQALLHFLINPIFDEQYIILFDNVQDLSSDMIDMLIFLIDNLYRQASSCMITISTNTEVIHEKNKEKIDAFFSFLDTLHSDYHILYRCSEMNYDDAKSLYFHALSTDNDLLVDKFIAKSGSRPFDIIMLIKFMHDNNIITWQSSYAWYITSFEKMNQFINTVPDGSRKLIRERVKLQRTNYGAEYWSAFKTVIKSLIYFQGFVPLEFFDYVQLDEDDLHNINLSLFIKYDDNLPAVTFFHDNIYRYFTTLKPYSVDISIAKKICNWIVENPAFPIDNRDSILFKTYNDMSDYNAAKEHGIFAMRENYNNRNYHECIKIGLSLKQNKYIVLSKQERFEIMHIISDSERERINHKEGARSFFETYEFLSDNINDITISPEQYNKFMHECINSQINAGYPSKAIEILKKFEQSKTLNDHYRFIVYNRYSVAYLATGETKKSKEYIFKAAELTADMNDKYLESIAFSDIAFIYFHDDEDRAQVINYFSKAVQNKEFCDFDSNRNAELLQQEALCLLLKNSYSEALDKVNKSIEQCEAINNSFLCIKAMALKSTIYNFMGEQDKAKKTNSKALLLCDETNSIVGKVKLYTNLSGIDISTGDFRNAQKNIDIAYDLFRDSGLSALKHKPLFYNYITIYSQSMQYDELFNRIRDCKVEKILNYLDSVFEHNSISISDEVGVIRNGRAIFNY